MLYTLFTEVSMLVVSQLSKYTRSKLENGFDGRVLVIDNSKAAKIRNIS